MKKLLIPLLGLLLLTVACSPVENNARDAAATLGGTLTYAQAKYGAECSNHSMAAVCSLVNQGVSAQNALVTATEAYCNWSTTAPPPDQAAKCVPVKGTEAALNTAIANANRIVSEIRGSL